MTTRVPPHDLEAEQCALGSALLSADAAEGLVVELAPSDYYRPAHALIHRAVAHLISRHEPVDAVAVADVLGKKLKEAGDRGYLLDITGVVLSASRWKHYCGIVAEKARLRNIIAAATEATAKAYDALPSADISETLAQATETTLPQHKSGTVRELMPSVVDGYRDKTETIRDSEFGLTFRKGDSCIIAAWPKVGKSAMCGQLAQQFGDRHLKCVIYSLEMSAEQWCTRYVAARGGYSLEQLEAGIGDKADGLATVVLSGDWPDFVTIVDDPTMNIAQFVADLRRRARKGLRVAFIDYLQLLVKQDYENVTEASRRVKLLARETGITIVSISQLRRPTDGAPKRPTMHHLKQSGALESDADLIVLLSDVGEEHEADVAEQWRQKGWHTNDPAYYGKKLCRYEVAANRHGAAFWTPAYFDGKDMTWQACGR